MFGARCNQQPLMKMEIAVLSAQGLKATSPTLFPRKIRPFIIITANGDHNCHVYQTRVDDQGGTNPTWGDKFHVPVEGTNFFTSRYSCIYLQLFSKGIMMGRSQLGWCQISAQDIGFSQPGLVRYLSYRLRAKDGSRTDGIVNLSIKLENMDHPVTSHGGSTVVNGTPCYNVCGGGTVIGTPVTTVLPPPLGCSCKDAGTLAIPNFQ